MRKLGWILAAGAGLLLIAVASRTPWRRESGADRPARPRAEPLAPQAALPHLDNAGREAFAGGSEPEESTALPEAAPEEGQAEEEFWTGVAEVLESGTKDGEEGPRERVIRRTAAYLGMSPEEEKGFEAVTRQAREAVARAWAVREEAWATASANVGLAAEVQEQVEREIQESYEREKQAALERVRAMLVAGERRVRFRERLEEWFDAVR